MMERTPGDTVAPTGLDADATGVEIEIVVDDDHLAEVEAEIADQRGDDRPAAVHVALRLASVTACPAKRPSALRTSPCRLNRIPASAATAATTRSPHCDEFRRRPDQGCRDRLLVATLLLFSPSCPLLPCLPFSPLSLR